MRRFLYFPLVLLLFTSFLSCKKDKSLSPVELGKELMPLEVGNWHIYQVDSTYYNDFNKTVTTYHYQLKEIIDSVFMGSNGQPIYRIERHKKDTITQAWLLFDVWTGEKTTSHFIKTEENVPIVKLKFPVSEGMTWNGNSYNTKEEQEFYYENTYQSYTLNHHLFDSTVTVIQQPLLTTIISQKQAYEVYALHIGLVYKIEKSLETEINGTITKGVNYTYTLVDYGTTH